MLDELSLYSSSDGLVAAPSIRCVNIKLLNRIGISNPLSNNGIDSNAGVKVMQTRRVEFRSSLSSVLSIHYSQGVLQILQLEMVECEERHYIHPKTVHHGA
jgi:hypothetical protein